MYILRMVIDGAITTLPCKRCCDVGKISSSGFPCEIFANIGPEFRILNSEEISEG